MRAADVLRYRLALRLDVGLFAQLLGVNPSSVYRWEHAAASPNIEPMQQRLLAEIAYQVARGRGKSLGKTIRSAILIRGPLYGLYKLLEAEFGDAKC